jgi:hypothetical protein
MSPGRGGRPWDGGRWSCDQLVDEVGEGLEQPQEQHPVLELVHTSERAGTRQAEGGL